MQSSEHYWEPASNIVTIIMSYNFHFKEDKYNKTPIAYGASLWQDPLKLPVYNKKGKRKVQGVPQSQTAALPRPQEEEETDKSKQAQTEQTYEKH